MADLVAQNDVDDRSALLIAHARQLVPDQRARIEPARLKRARHQRQPRQQVLARALGHVPEPVMRRKIAIIVTQTRQVRLKQPEMEGLFARHAGPVPVKRYRQTRKPPDSIEREVNGIELDMRQRMQENGTPFDGGDAAVAQLGGRHEHRARWPARDQPGRRQRRIGVEGDLRGHRVQNGVLVLPGRAGECLQRQLS